MPGILLTFVSMNYMGIVIGVSTFLIIGLFHPIVIKSEYYFGKRCWWVFLVTAFSCFWSILELYEQEKRVDKGWFPRNPKRKR